MFWKILIVFFVSMLPIIEIRGSVPLGMALGVDLPEWAILLIATIGNLIPMPIIYFFAKKVLKWGQKGKIKWFKKFCTFCLEKGKRAGDKLLQKAKGGAYFALYLFVAIPIPGTGVWVGTLAASLLDLDFKKSLFAIIPGVITAGLILLLASLGVIGIFK